MKFTLIGDVEAAVVGSVTANRIEVTEGWDALRLKIVGDTDSGEITSGTDSRVFLRGFELAL